MTQQTKKTRIICLGNEIACDDGVGIRVGRILRMLEMPAHIVTELRRCIEIEFIDEMRAGDEIVLVDATQAGGGVGRCRVIPVFEAAAMADALYCCHGMGIAEVLKIAVQLFPERLPSKVVVVGIEGQLFDRFGTTLTSRLQDALPRAVETVLRTVSAPEILVKEGVLKAELLKGWKPDIKDALG